MKGRIYLWLWHLSHSLQVTIYVLPWLQTSNENVPTGFMGEYWSLCDSFSTEI